MVIFYTTYIAYICELSLIKQYNMKIKITYHNNKKLFVSVNKIECVLHNMVLQLCR